MNIPVRRSTPKHNFGSGAVKLPHSGVETKNNYQENKAKQATATENPAKQLEKQAKQAETKETQVVKSEKSETSEAGVTAELEAKPERSSEKAKLRAKTVSTSHENNLNVLIIIAGGLAWFLFR